MAMTFKDLSEHMSKLQKDDMAKEVMLLTDEGYVPLTFVWDLTSDGMFFVPALPEPKENGNGEEGSS